MLKGNKIILLMALLVPAVNLNQHTGKTSADKKD